MRDDSNLIKFCIVNTFKGVRAEVSEVVLRQVQVDQSLHSTESPALHLPDLAALQMEGHDLGNAGEAVAGDVVEVVAAQVEETRVGRETPRNFGVSAVLTRGVVRLGLKTGR